MKSHLLHLIAALGFPFAAVAADVPLPPAPLPPSEKVLVLELRDEIPTHFRFKPRTNETIPASITRVVTHNGRRDYEAVVTVLGPNQGLRMNFKTEMFFLDAKRMGYRWDKGQTVAGEARSTMVGSTACWYVFPTVAAFDPGRQPALHRLSAINLTHRNVRYTVQNLPDRSPKFDVNKWDFVYDFNITGVGEIIIALAGDMKHPDRGVGSQQPEPVDPVIVADRFGNRFRYEAVTRERSGGYFHLVRQVDAKGHVLVRPKRIPDQVDILPIVRHVITVATRRGTIVLPTVPTERHRLGHMLIGSEIWDQTRGVITMDRDIDLECVFLAPADAKSAPEVYPPLR